MANVFINEIHYDNDGTDTGEAIELAGLAGTNLAGWSLVLYNGNGGAVYDTDVLTGLTIPDQENGFGTVFISYPSNGIQNGSPDGIALVDNGNVVQFLSYEGTFTAVGGPANGLTSTDIGVAESSTTPVGFSLQLTGTGSTYTDFTWSPAADDSFGAINQGQTFGDDDTTRVTIQATDADAAEAGANPGTFTISRTGDTTAALAVSYTVAGSATNGTDYTPSLSGTATIAAGSASVDIAITPVDDSDIEGSETVTLELVDTDDYNLGNSTATVTITDNDVALTPIYTIQGAAHSSSLVGQSVTTTGIVTAVDSNGFYLQEPNGDNNTATSDGIFVFTGGAPSVNVGDALQVEGDVSEFIPGGTSTGNLSITQISGSPTVTVLSRGNPLPASVILGTEGRTPPTQAIDNDRNTKYDVLAGEGEYQPDEDGIDFYESLEGMRVKIDDPLAVSPTNGFGEIFTVADNGANATNLSERGTINIGPGDFNPERIQIQFDSGILPNSPVNVNTGARLEDVTGVVGYNFGNFEVNVTESFGVVEESNLQPEVSNITRTADRLTVASYNVLNLDPKVEDINLVNDRDPDEIDDDVADGRFEAIAAQIVNNLNLPDVIGLQEVQDNNGAEITDVTAANETLQLLVDEIQELSGVTYQFIDNPFIGNETGGGQPGGNIRTAFLYNPNRVSLVEGSVQTITDPQDQQTNPDNPFFESRLPLAATFAFNGQEVTVVDNHFSSKGGSSPLFGRTQPAEDLQEDPDVNGSLDQRREQAQAVKGFVDNILASNPEANVVVNGDLNEFEFISPLETLEQSLTNLTETLPENERYSFIFDGNSQALDHILVSDSLDEGALFDAVHVNTEFAQRSSDHDPLLASVLIEQPANVINGTPKRDIIVGTDGDDIITGFRGRDLLTGNEGSDQFVYTRLLEGRDRITDFEVGSDRIVLTDLLDSLGYDGEDAIADGFVRFKGTRRQPGSLIEIDSDGFSGRGRSRSLIFVEEVTVAEINDASNFVF